jgi:hypothetical protein
VFNQQVGSTFTRKLSPGREFRVFAFFLFRTELSILRTYSTIEADRSLLNLTDDIKGDKDAADRRR